MRPKHTLLLCLAVALALILAPERAWPVEVRQLAIEAMTYTPGGRVPELNGFQPVNRLALDVDLNLARLGPVIVFVDSQIFSIIDPGQFRLVGLRYNVGLDVQWWILDVQWTYYHKSQHVLDAPGIANGFPVEDGIQAKLFIIRMDRRPARIDP